MRSVKRSILVGSGTGPLTVAPVRLAVSTISFAELSMRRWSKAFRRIRIFWFAMISLAEIACGDFSGLPHYFVRAAGEKHGFRPRGKPSRLADTHFNIFATPPAPEVLAPSRIENFKPWSMEIQLIN